MYNVKKITDDLFYIGVNDRKIALFESVYPLKSGVSYNSYFLDDEKTVLFDTVDKDFSIQFFENLDQVLKNKKLDYFVIHHMEPDHSALIKNVIEKYPDVKIVCNQKLKQMLFQFFDFAKDIESNFHIVAENDTLNTGKHELVFVMAPMVHWPEVIVSYDKTDKILFSADAFGSFDTLDGNIFDDEVEFSEKTDEYRRYYTNIVGKYGAQTNAVLNKAKNLEIKTICPLHGLILRKNIPLIIDKYAHWASYEPEIKSVLLLYSSVYGSTENTVDILASKLAQKGVKNIKVINVSRIHGSYVLAEAFKYSHIVIATTTYNNSIFTSMDNVLTDFIKHNLMNRNFAIIENGSWAPNAAKLVKTKLEELKGSNFIEDVITVKSSFKENQIEEITALADKITASLNQ